MKKFIVAFLILPILFSCSNISQKTSVSFSLSRSAAQTIINSNPDYSDILIECSLSTEESNTITVPVQTVSDLTFTFNDIVAGSKVYATAFIYGKYKNFNSSVNSVLLYKGISEEITVYSGENILSLKLKEIPDTTIGIEGISFYSYYEKVLADKTVSFSKCNDSQNPTRNFYFKSSDELQTLPIYIYPKFNNSLSLDNPEVKISYFLNGVEQTPTSENKLLIDDSEYLINSSLAGSVNKVVVSVEYKSEVKSEEIQFYVYDTDSNSTAESQ